MTSQDVDRIKAWEARTGGFLNISSQGSGTPDFSGVPF